MYLDKPITVYVADAAARKSAPGGGSVSAMVAALAGTMCSMAANFTTGEKFKDAAPKIDAILRDCAAVTDDCLKMVEKDVIEYGAIDRAYTMPRGTEEEKQARAAAVQEAMKTAMGVPLALFRRCAELFRLLDRLVDISNPNLISDVGVSAYLADGAMHGARLNVEINCKYLKDEALVSKTRAEIEKTLAECAKIKDRVTGIVNSKVK